MAQTSEEMFNFTQATLSVYFSAIGLSILIYDHLLSVDDEVEYIWKAKLSAPKVCFLLVRYLMPIALLVNAYQQSSNNVSLPQIFCKVWFNVAAVIFIIVTGIENFLILLRVWFLNDRKRNIMKWTTLLYLVMQAMTIGWTVAVMAKNTGLFAFMPVGQVGKERKALLCSTSSRGLLPALYIPTVLFEAVMLALILWGTYVRSRNATGNSLFRYLIHDGFIYILLLFLLRVTNMIITASAPAPLIFASLYFGCATSGATVSRLILNLRKESVIKRRLMCPVQMQAGSDGVHTMTLPTPVIAGHGGISVQRVEESWPCCDADSARLKSEKYAPSDGH